jgi:hypothetical protein
MELKLEDDYRVCSPELHRSSPEFGITWAIDLWFKIRKVQERVYAKGNSPVTLEWLQICRKSHSPMRNNSKTLVWFFFLWLGPWLLTIGTWFNLKGELRNRGGSDDGQRRRWCNSSGGYRSVLRGNWHGDAWGRCTQAYIGDACGRSPEVLGFELEIKSEFN